jgi:hypothetical protein
MSTTIKSILKPCWDPVECLGAIVLMLEETIGSLKNGI